MSAHAEPSSLGLEGCWATLGEEATLGWDYAYAVT